MPPTPVVLGAVIVLVLISMLAARGLGVISLGKALGSVVAVAIVVIPLGLLATALVPADTHRGPAGAGDATRGEALFRQGVCPTCHTIQGISTATIGPDLTRIGSVGATRKPNMSAEAYIRESIEQPQAFTAPGATVPMPSGLAQGQALDDLVAYLVTRT